MTDDNETIEATGEEASATPQGAIGDNQGDAPAAEGDKQGLTLQQELFCRLYTQNETLFGNGTLAYAEAYNYSLNDIEDAELRSKSYDTCSVNASRLLRSDKIQRRVWKLLNEFLTDEMVDSQLARLIMDSKEPATRIAAIREYNKLRQRIIDRTDVTSGGAPLAVNLMRYDESPGTNNSAVQVHPTTVSVVDTQSAG